MPDIHEIDAAVAMAEAETGILGGQTKFRVCAQPAKHRPRSWTKEENDFVRKNLGRISEAEMAAELRRTVSAIHNHVTREMHLCSPSKSPDILTAEHIAVGLGCDGKTIHRLIDTGLMPGRRLPTARTIRVVDRLALLRWICEPAHWIYFKRERVGEMRPHRKRGMTGVYDFAFWEDARKVVLAASRKWRDEWLMPSQVVKLMGLPFWRRKYVNLAVLRGTLKATRWGNWWILKSDLPRAGMTINFRGSIVKS